MAVHFDHRKAKNGKSYFNLIATNVEVILTCQMYSSGASARKGIASVQTNAGSANRYERRQGKGGKSHFVLKAANHRVIGTSETYNSKASLEKGIKSVMKNGKVKKVADG